MRSHPRLTATRRVGLSSVSAFVSFSFMLAGPLSAQTASPVQLAEPPVLTFETESVLRLAEVPPPPPAVKGPSPLETPAESTTASAGSSDVPEGDAPSDSSPSSGATQNKTPESDQQKSKKESQKDAKKEPRSAGAESLTPIQNRPLNKSVSAINISMEGIGTGDIPKAVTDGETLIVALPTGYDRGATFKPTHWRASNICHYPLYFEDAMLERHGHTRYGYHLQPLVSGAKFFTTLSLLPYLKTLQPTCRSRYALGHYRPGSCAPVLRDTIPWDKRAALVESASAAAFFWAAPL